MSVIWCLLNNDGKIEKWHCHEIQNFVWANTEWYRNQLCLATYLFERVQYGDRHCCTIFVLYFKNLPFIEKFWSISTHWIYCQSKSLLQYIYMVNINECKLNHFGIASKFKSVSKYVLLIAFLMQQHFQRFLLRSKFQFNYVFRLRLLISFPSNLSKRTLS
jgi:hypothetical protein